MGIPLEEIFIVGICLTLNALFAAYEMAFVSVPRSELLKLAKNGNKDAQRLLGLREKPERTLSVLQIGITLVGALGAAIGGAGAAESLEPYLMQKLGLGEVSAEVIAVFLIVLPITYLSVVIGELVPKTLALRNPVGIVLRGTSWLFVADRMLAPIVSFLEWSTRVFLKTFFRRSKPQANGGAHLTVELDSLSPTHQEYVLNLAHIERKKIKDLLVPWSSVTRVRSTDQMNEIASLVLSSGHTRLPVVDSNGITGILHTKEFLAYRESGATHWLSIVRSPLKVKDQDSVLGVLRLMQEKKSHMVLVISPTGECLGIVTLEDIIEEIVGDIFDEDDDGRVRRILADKVRSRVLPDENR